MRIDWQYNLAAACWHAVASVRQGLSLLNADLEEAIRPLIAAETQTQLSPSPELLEACRTHLAGKGEDNLVQELKLRTGPLRDLWGARGPGLMRGIVRLTGLENHSKAIAVQMVPPLVGGHGIVVPGAGAITFEAVLANPIPELPETVRLACLLAQASYPAPTPWLAAALLPAVLSAGSDVELCGDDLQTVAAALDAWHVQSPRSLAAEQPLSAEQLASWWQRFRESSLSWEQAIQELA